MPKWRNRKTRYVQGVVRVRAWEFESPLRHHRREPGATPDRTLTIDVRRAGDRWQFARGKSELHRAGCLVKARETGPVPSTVQIGGQIRLAESNRDQYWPVLADQGEKGNPPRSNPSRFIAELLAVNQVESRRRFGVRREASR